MTSKLRELDYIKAWMCSAASGLVGSMILTFFLAIAVARIQSLLGGPSLDQNPPDVLLDVLFVVGGLIAAAVSYASFRLFVAIFIVRKLAVTASGAARQSAA